MKRLFSLWCLIWLALLPLAAQQNKLIRELEARRRTLQEQIEGTEQLLQSTRKDIGSQLDNLALLTGQMEERRRYIARIGDDLKALDREVLSLESQLRRRQRELEVCRQRYAQSVRYLQRNKTVEEKLLFILSAETLSQSLRRLRYVREYATFQRLQGEEIRKKQAEIVRKQQEVRQVRGDKARLLAEREQEVARLQKQEQEQRSAVAALQKRQRNLQAELRKRRKEAEQLNSRIDRLIAEALEEARRKNSKSGSGAAPMEGYTLSKADKALSSDFASNRGRLPMPVSGPYILVGHYGAYNVPGLRNVRLDNKGIDIQAKPGAVARAIFNGKVAAVFQLNGLFHVLVRHGSYISVYCNLSSTSVKQGDDVRTKQTLGTIFSEDGKAVLHFQLRREKEKLNPEPWLNR